MRPNDSPKPGGSTFSPDAFPDGLLVVDSNLNPVCCNAAFTEMWNVAQADVRTAPGYALIDRLAGAVVDSADFSARAKSLREPPAGRSHESLILNDGRVFEWFSEPLTTNPHAKEALAAWIFRDVTTGTGGLHHVIDDAEEFRAIVDQNVAGVYVLELDGTIAYINPTFARMAGYEQADLLGRSFGEFVADGDRREAMANFSRLIAGEIQAVPHTVACVGKNGRTITVLSQATVARHRGRPAIIGVTVDVTQLQRAEEAVRASEERLRVLLESAPDAILLYDDRKDRFVEANRAAEALFECGRDELLERGARAFYSAIQPGGTDLVASFREHTARALAGEPVKFERLITTAKGNERLIEVQLALLPTADGFVIRSSFVDVTKARQTEVALRRFNRALATLSASNAALVRATSERDLLQAMCEVAVGVGGYRMAWIGFAEHDAAKTVRPAAMAGHGTDFLKNADIRWADTGRGQGPAGRAIRTRTLIVNRNYEDNPAVAPWRDEATKRGFRSSVAVPLMDDGAAFGAFALYSGEADAFDDDEVTLLAELGADISYGIVALRDRAAREAAQIRLRDSMRETVASLAGMIELRDPYTAGHQRNVSSLAVAIARQMELPETEIGGVAVAGLVLDIGKIQTPAEFLSKPGRLTPTEFATIQMHPQAGYDILKRIRFPWPVAEMVLQHHERLDGSGYPNELHAADILLGAKILAVADVVEAMTFHRPYRPAYGIESALAEIAAGKGRLYERSAVEACEKVFEDGFAFPPPEGDRPRT